MCCDDSKDVLCISGNVDFELEPPSECTSYLKACTLSFFTVLTEPFFFCADGFTPELRVVQAQKDVPEVCERAQTSRL